MCTLINPGRTPFYLFLAVMVCACSPHTQQMRAVDEFDQLELSLKTMLPTGWTISKQGNTLQLTRSNRLWVYNPTQQDVRVPLNEWVKKVGEEVTYTITLRFEPLIPKEQYDQLKTERAPYERIINEGARSIDEWEDALNEFNKRRLPVYFTDHYSIYAEKPDTFQRVYPELAAFECKQVVSSLDHLLKRYEPFSGKATDFQVRT